MAEWHCKQCERELVGEEICPECGPVGRHMDMHLHSSVIARTAIALVKETPSLPRKKRIRIRYFDGWQLRKSVGDLVRKMRRIDRDARTYDEVVHDEEGKLLHECHEPLEAHTGHGSDKPELRARRGSDE